MKPFYKNYKRHIIVVISLSYHYSVPLDTNVCLHMYTNVLIIQYNIKKQVDNMAVT